MIAIIIIGIIAIFSQVFPGPFSLEPHHSAGFKFLIVRLQVSDCSTFLIMRNVPCTAVFFLYRIY
jgi:hypothetical protein